MASWRVCFILSPPCELNKVYNVLNCLAVIAMTAKCLGGVFVSIQLGLSEYTFFDFVLLSETFISSAKFNVIEVGVIGLGLEPGYQILRINKKYSYLHTPSSHLPTPYLFPVNLNILRRFDAYSNIAFFTAQHGHKYVITDADCLACSPT
jgi:hypothetical protein